VLLTRPAFDAVRASAQSGDVILEAIGEVSLKGFSEPTALFTARRGARRGRRPRR
jgi:class 3 adenylate cyclase